VALLLLLVYSLSAFSCFGSRSSSSSSSPGSLVQQFLSQFGTGDEQQLVQQHILAHTDWLTSLSEEKLPLLLQGTNFKNLSTAAVLDGASHLTSQQKWQLANLHQKLLCA
jgi:hypothetical protein